MEGVKGEMRSGKWERMSRLKIDGAKCIICGYRKRDFEQKHLPEPLCSFCANPRFMAVLEEVIQQLDDEINGSILLDCDANPLLSFVADLGMLGTQHPFLASMRKVLGELVRQVSAEGIAEVDQLRWSGARFRQTVLVLGLLLDLGFISLEEENTIVRPINPVFRKVATATEVDARLERASTFILGYVILKTIDRTLHLIKEKGTLYYGEGITKIYIRDKRDRVMILRAYTSLISLIFGTWALGKNEVDESFLHLFLSNRQVTGRDYFSIKNWLTGSMPGSVIALYTFETHNGVNGFPVCVFKLNPEYQRIRDRILERIRERERARGEGSE